MSLLESILFGILEGLTEFLPISSTAHLILVSSVLKIKQTPFHTFFEIFIQGSAILAVLPLFIKRIKTQRELSLKVLISFFPTAFIGFLFYKIVKNVFFLELKIIIFSLIVIGIIFIVIEMLIKKGVIHIKKDLTNLNVIDAILIGLAQSLAIIPGVSRAGIVMICMMVMGYKRSESALYSFYLAIPTILSASMYDLIKTDIMLLKDVNNLVVLIVGTLTSFITAFITVRVFIRFLRYRTLFLFGVYRILIALLFLAT